jgi:hypothetical protein
LLITAAEGIYKRLSPALPAVWAAIGCDPQPGRRPDTLALLPGDVAEWLRSGLQSRLHRFDSGRRLHAKYLQKRGFR